MQDFLNFLNAYKEVIISIFACLLTIICIFAKRRPKTLDDFLMIVDEALLQVPTFINKVECPGNGADKKSLVVGSVSSLVSRKLGRKLSDSERDYLLIQASDTIESVLSTPTKKESIRIC